MRLHQIVKCCPAIFILTVEICAILHAQCHSRMVLLLSEQDECAALEWVQSCVDLEATFNLIQYCLEGIRFPLVHEL